MFKDFIYVALSQDVYRKANRPDLPGDWRPYLDSSVCVTQSESSVSDANRPRLFGDWFSFKASSACSTQTDYFGSAYISDSKQEIIIAHRGSVIQYNKWQDFLMLIDHIPKYYEEDALPFVATVLENVARTHPGYKISQTGHSLGANLAELCAATYEHLCVTFESPGSRGFVQKLISDGKLSPDALGKADNNIRTYNAGNSCINGLNKHLGRIFRVYPPYLEDRGSDILSLRDALGDYEFITYGFDNQHPIKGIYDQFNPDTEIPRVYCEIDRAEWDNIYYIDFDQNPHYWYGLVYNFWVAQGSQGSFDDFLYSQFSGVLPLLFHDPACEILPGRRLIADSTATEIFGTTMRQDVLEIPGGAPTIYSYGQNQFQFSAATGLTDIVDIISRRLSAGGDQELGGGWIYLDGQLVDGVAQAVNGTQNNKFTLDANSKSYTLQRILVGGNGKQNLFMTWGSPSIGINFNDFTGGEFNLILKHQSIIVSGNIYNCILTNGNVISISNNGFVSYIYDRDGKFISGIDVPIGTGAKSQCQPFALEAGAWAMIYKEGHNYISSQRKYEYYDIHLAIYTAGNQLIQHHISAPLQDCYMVHAAYIENQRIAVIYYVYNLMYYCRVFDINAQAVTSWFELTEGPTLCCNSLSTYPVGDKKFIVLLNGNTNPGLFSFICHQDGNVLEKNVLVSFGGTIYVMKPQAIRRDNGFSVFFDQKDLLGIKNTAIFQKDYNNQTGWGSDTELVAFNNSGYYSYFVETFDQSNFCLIWGPTNSPGEPFSMMFFNANNQMVRFRLDYLDVMNLPILEVAPPKYLTYVSERTEGGMAINHFEVSTIQLPVPNQLSKRNLLVSSDQLAAVPSVSPLAKSDSSSIYMDSCFPLTDGSLYCTESDFHVRVFAKADSHAMILRQMVSPGITGDIYDPKSCRSLDFEGRPSVDCDGKTTTMVYTPHTPTIVNLMANLDGNIGLVAIACHIIGKGTRWACSLWSGEKTVKQEYASNDEFIAITKRYAKTLEKIDLDLQIETSKLDKFAQQAPASLQEMIKIEKERLDAMRWALQDHQENLDDLMDEGKITRDDLDEIKRDIVHLAKEHAEDQQCRKLFYKEARDNQSGQERACRQDIRIIDIPQNLGVLPFFAGPTTLRQRHAGLPTGHLHQLSQGNQTIITRPQIK